MANVNVAIRITSNYRGGPGFKKADRDVKKFRRSVGRAANSVRAFQFVLAGVTISTLTIWGKKLVDVAGELQLLQIRLTAVEGSVEGADRQFRSLFERFKEVPFQLDAITDGFVRLRAAGVSTEDANRTINNLVDAVAVFGGSTAELQRATIGFQQVAGKGVLSMEELRQQIGESIPAAMALMSRAAGVTIGEFVEQVKRGTISASEAFRLFNEESERQFGGFAETLRTTIVGSIAGLKSRVRFAIGDLFNVRTDLSQRIATFIQVLTDRIVRFIESFDQQRVERFWAAFEGIAQLIEGIIQAISGLVFVLGSLFGAAGQAAGVTGGRIIVAGIIGSMLFGKGAGLIIAGLTGIASELGFFENFMRTVESFQKRGHAAGGAIGRILDVTGGRGGGGIFPFRKPAQDLSQFQGSLIPPDARAARQQRLEFNKLADLQRQAPQIKGGLLGLSGAFGNLSIEMVKLADRARIAADNTLTPWLKASDRMRIGLKKIEEGIADLETKFSEAAEKRQQEIDALIAAGGDENRITQKKIELEEAHANKVKQMSKLLQQQSETRAAVARRDSVLTRRALDKQMEKLSELGDAADLALGTASPFQISLRQISRESRDTIKGLDLMIARLDRIIEASTGVDKALARGNKALAENQKRLEKQKELQNTINTAILKVDRITRLKTEGQIIKANSAEEIRQLKRRFSFGVKNIINDELSNEVLSIKNELLIRSLEIQQDIDEARTKIAIDPTADKDALQEKIAAWTELKDAMEAARQKVSETALLEQELWRNLGQIIENNVGNAIEGLVTGTKTLKEAMLDLWRSAIREVANYVAKLLVAKAIQSAMGIFGASTPFFGVSPLAPGHGNPFALGGAFAGKIKPFANGDILRGPTMFGLAGEAGTEAIMPLKRGSDGKLGVAGGGGDQFNITIQAIDAQTGTQFLLDHMSDIAAGLTHENSLNRGIRRGVN